MELVLTKEEFEPLPKRNEDLFSEPSGFLNSHYKNIVKENYLKKDSTTIFNIRRKIRSRNYAACCGVGIAIKLSVFLAMIILIFN